MSSAPTAEHNNDNTRPRRTKLQMENELIEMQKRISSGYTDKEIMKDLALTRRLFYYYKHKLYKLSAQTQAKKNEDILAFEQEILKDRMIRVFRAMEIKASDPATRGSDAAQCAAIAQELAINILKLESEGLRASAGINYIVHKAESKGLVKYDNGSYKHLEDLSYEVPKQSGENTERRDDNNTRPSPSTDSEEVF